jgi:hypothetical protein
MTLVTFTVIVGPPLTTEPTPNLTLRFSGLLMEPGLLAARPDNLEGWSSCLLRYRPIHDAKRSVPYPWKPRKSSVLLRAILGDGYTKKNQTNSDVFMAGRIGALRFRNSVNNKRS